MIGRRASQSSTGIGGQNQNQMGNNLNGNNFSFPSHQFVWKRVSGKNCDICNQSFWLSFGYECSNCALFVHKGCMKGGQLECRLRTEIYVLSHTNQLMDSPSERERFFKLNGIKKENHINRIFYSTVDRKLVALDDGGEAYSINIENFPEELAIVKPMQFLPMKQILQVSAGANHTLFLTNNGHVYSMGSNQFGQLGVGSDLPDSSSPLLLSSLINKITDKIVCGGHHSLILTMDGEIYSWGMGEHGRLGNASEENQFHPLLLNPFFSFPFEWQDSHPVLHSSASKNKMQGITISIPSPPSLPDTKYIEVKVDPPSSLSSSSSSPSTLPQDPLFSSQMMRNNRDELIHSTSITSHLSSFSEPLSAEETALRMMSTLSSSIDSLFSTSDPDLQFNSDQVSEEKVMKEERIVHSYTKPVICSVACGWGHSLVLFRCRRITARLERVEGVIQAHPIATHRSILFTFGKNDFGQCGHSSSSFSSSTHVSTPKIISSLRNEAISQVTGGFYHSSVVTDDGKVFCFGATSEGQCGPLSPSSSSAAIQSNPIPVDIGTPVRMITCGNFHNIVQCTNGQVFVWGRLFNSTHFIPTSVEKLSGKKLVSMISGMLSTIVVIADSIDHSLSSSLDSTLDPVDSSSLDLYPSSQLSTSPTTGTIGGQQGGGMIGNIWTSVSKGFVTNSEVSPGTSPVGSPSRSSTPLHHGKENYWTPFTNLEETQSLILNIRKGIPDNHRLKVWLFISGCTELLSSEEGLYARSIRSAYSSDEVNAAVNAEGTLAFEEIPLKPMSLLNGYLPDGFSYQSHNLSSENVIRMQRLLWVLYKKATPHFMFLHPILPDLICLLLHYTSEEQAYFTTWALFNQSKVSDFAQFNIPELYSSVLLNSLRMCAPDLYNHLLSIVDPEDCTFATSWFTRLFVGKFPYRLVLRIFDCFLSEGLLVLFRVGIAVFLINTDILLKCTTVSQMIGELNHYMKECKEDDALIELAYEVSFRRNSCLDYLRSSRDASLPSNLDFVSQILNHEQICTLWLWLPLRCRLDEPQLIFSTSSCGFNISTLVSKSSSYNPSILVIKTSDHHIFGAFITANWEKGDKFHGSGETFVFSLFPKMRKYPWTKDNSLFFLVSNALMIGGGGSGCSLYLDDELNHGSCNRSATFDNPNLCGNKKDFDAVEVEVFGWSSMRKI